MAIGTLFIANKFSSITSYETEIKDDGPFCGNVEVLTESEQKGKVLFSVNCASCHKLGMDMTGPDLRGFEQRGPWADRKKFYQWLNDPTAFMENDKYTRDLRVKYRTMMISFDHLTKEEMDAIADYIN
jgi:mono/diheme cytochrome c family protein